RSSPAPERSTCGLRWSPVLPPEPSATWSAPWRPGPGPITSSHPTWRPSPSSCAREPSSRPPRSMRMPESTTAESTLAEPTTAGPTLHDPARRIRAARGNQRTAKSWGAEAAKRMLMNNLDAEVAEHPEDLVVYGGTGRAARSWEAYDAIVRTLDELEPGEDRKR